MRIFEAFTETIRRKAREENDSCAICHTSLPPDSAADLHSGTGLHLYRKNPSKDSKFIATSTIEGHKTMKGRTVSSKIWPYDTKTDGVLVCILCYDELWRIASAEARLRGYREPTPQIVADVTLFAIARGKPLVYDLID